ncbi:uncharacterized protein LOC100854735 isoform X6 [Vitis vinifera]|uniref:uncharacterized protein LOC100854735 isoform X6 n=1 Tax=Vitis vinifera TaxID=29760 RepID=UPI002883153E|nr:uncharacterized protein LOC100854735 isoform X6 [Vitis vinifera]
MEQTESDIKRVLQDYQKIGSGARCEEARIEVLNREIKVLEDRVRGSGSVELERHRMRNLLDYQSTLIARAVSRTELLAALYEDLLLLFIRRKQLRGFDGAEGSGVDAAPNVSLSSALSGGDDENQRFAKNCSELRSMHIMRMSHHEDLEEETTADQQPIPLGVKLLQINMNEDASLTSEDGLENSNILCVESEGSKKAHRKSSRAKRLFVDFDETGNPTGPSAGVFKRSINSYVCQLLPIRFKQIGEIPVEDYKSVVNALTERYSFDLDMSYTRKKISSCYRQHKYKLLIQVKKDLERGIEPQKPSYVDEEDWNAFVAKTKDEEFDRISKKNKASRSQQSALNKKDVQSTAHKRKKGDQGPEGISIWSKLHKPKQGMAKWAAWSGYPGKLLAIVEDSQNVMDTMVLPINEEVVQEQDLESELPLKDYPQLDTPSQYDYWNAT